MLTDQGANIPWLHLQEKVITQEEINSFFAAGYRKAIIQNMLISFAISLVFSFLFASILTAKALKNMEETVNNLKNISDKTHSSESAFSKDFSKIEAAFLEAEKKNECLYEDFDHLSSYISHEQKNALAVLRAMIQNEGTANAEQLVAQIDRMVKSMDNILSLSTNTAVLEPVDLPLICGMVADEYRKVYTNIIFDFDEEASLWIAGHELLCYRAVSNLVDNAIKYGQDKPVTVYAGIQNGCPYVSVEDQGCGIGIEQQEKIFESRYRIGSRKKDGYGIGLSLVRHVAELCGGFVWVDSRENGGSKFKIVFPPFTVD